MFKLQDFSTSLWAVLVTATILASIPANAQGLICYSCKTPNDERTIEGKERQQNSSNADTGNATGRLKVDYDCGKNPTNTLNCPGEDCYYNVNPNAAGGTSYYRHCARTEHTLGCKKTPNGAYNCYCDTSLCNGKLSYGLRSSEYSIATTVGLLFVLLLM